MRKSIMTAAIIAILTVLAPLGSTAQTTAQPYIDMNATVQREVTPDELYLKITISERDYKGKKSLEEMQKSMIDVLEACRIDIAENLTINYMGSEVSYKAFSKKVRPKSEAVYMLRLNDAAAMQQVIMSLEEQQISNIELTKVKFTKEKELKREMAVVAMQQAQEEARVLAGAIGQEIGKAITINSWMNGGGVQPRMYKARNSAMMDGVAVEESAAEAPIFSIGKITYSFNVTVRFELK